MVAVLKEPKRTLISCRKAAEILGCTMGRVRQMARGDQPTLWSAKLGARALVLDAAEVKRLAAARHKARDARTARGPAFGGFQPDS